MARSCTELWLAPAQAEGVRARTAPRAQRSCLQQDPRSGGTQEEDRQLLTLLWTHRCSPENNTARGLFLISVSRWYTGKPGSGNRTQPK